MYKDLEIIQTCSPEFRALKVRALLKKQRFILEQIHKIMESGIVDVVLIYDWVDYSKCASRWKERREKGEEHNEHYIFVDEQFYNLIQNARKNRLKYEQQRHGD